MSSLRILNWNIYAGGKPEHVLAHISSVDPDIMVLSEFRYASPSGKILRERLRQKGYKWQQFSNESGINGVLIASRIPSQSWDYPLVQSEPILAGAIFNGFRILGMFLSDWPAVQRLLLRFAEESNELLSGPTLLIGDFNYGPTASDQGRYQLLDNLLSLGWVDLWRHHKGTELKPEYWTHKNRAFLRKPGMGYSLVDHFIVSPDIAPMVETSPVVDQSVMARGPDDVGCSDHASVCIELRAPDLQFSKKH